MKIKYILSKTSEQITQSDELVLKSIQANLNEGDTVDFVFYNENEPHIRSLEEEVNVYLEKFLANEQSEVPYTHICLIPFESRLSSNFKDIVKDYVLEDNVVYLPIVELDTLDEKKELQFKAFLNTGIWKPYFTSKVGILDLQFALKQIDLTLFGALIPISVVKEYKFNTEIKYFSFFEYINRLLFDKKQIKGIPKSLLRTYIDYELKNVSIEDKKKYFKMANEKYLQPISKNETPTEPLVAV